VSFHCEPVGSAVTVACGPALAVERVGTVMTIKGMPASEPKVAEGEAK
jgi:hypothetical protein